MDCPQTPWPSNKEYLQALYKKATERRIPLSGSLVMTHRCNLNCVHCYLNSEETRLLPHSEMTTKQIISIVDMVTEAGCLYLLITGGEALLRKDFSSIYRHAKQNGLLVSVFTNGTLIKDDIVRLFAEFPPYDVEISLYGATASTYEKITQVTGSYEKCLAGIQQLLENNINVKLKTILMTLNRHEFSAMENMAKNFGVKFRFDAAIFPRLNGDKGPLSFRVHPKEAIEKEMRGENTLRKWKEYLRRFEGTSMSNALYQCGAGITSFCIDPYGNLQPCLMSTACEYNLLDGDFLTGWHEVIPHIRERKAGNTYACNTCAFWMLCGHCPAFFELENGAEDIPSDYLCDMGRYRYQTISETTLNEVEIEG